MKKLISLRISPLTETQLTELTSKLGMTQTDVVTMAINDFYDKMEYKIMINDIKELKKLGYTMKQIKELSAAQYTAGRKYPPPGAERLIIHNKQYNIWLVNCAGCLYSRVYYYN